MGTTSLPTCSCGSRRGPNDPHPSGEIKDPYVVRCGPDLDLRRLHDGSKYQVVEVFYVPKELQSLLGPTALHGLSSLKQAIGDLDCIDGWAIVNRFVNAGPGDAQTMLVLKPFSDVILAVFGPAIGAHARTAIRVATVPLNLSLVVSAEVELLSRYEQPLHIRALA